MNRDDQLKRIGTYLCRKSAIENYCEEHYRPVRDCIKNQEDTCNKNERECNFGIFENFEYQGEIIKNSKKLTKTQLIEAYEMYEDYLPCSNCKEYDNYQLGTVWLEKVKQVDVLTTKEAVHAVDTFFIKNKRRFKLSTHANGTLSVKDIENILNEWFIDDGFVADIILIDYLELLVTEGGKEERHAQNKIAKELRKLSQTPKQNKLPLVVTATQSDAESYGANTLKMKHFSEDKRKYAHVTAMYGLNQDPQGREKEIGLLRINEIIKREGAFSNNKQITILQDLNQGRPFLGSYF
jgi:phage anti-repressor protein